MTPIATSCFDAELVNYISLIIRCYYYILIIINELVDSQSIYQLLELRDDRDGVLY